MKEKIPYLGTGAAIGAIIPYLLGTGIFATRADLADYRAEVAEKYVQKSEIAKQLDEIKITLKDMNLKIDRNVGK